jgi:uncharacterized repeat protein (TIGR02543 family)
MVLGVQPLTYAAEPGYGDIETSYAKEAILALTASGVVEGYEAKTFGPKDSIKSVDLDISLARLTGKKAPRWVDSKVLTREQASKSIATALGLSEVQKPAFKYLDDASISAEYKGWVYALKEAGYQVGDSFDAANSRYFPKNTFTREAIMQTIYSALGKSSSAIIDKDVSGKSFNGTAIIRKSGVTLKDATINGDLIIGQGVGEGEVHLDNVLVKGNTIVYGGGISSLYVADFRVEGSLIVRKYEGENNVRIVVSGASNFDAIVLETGAIIVTQQLADGTKIKVEIPSDYLAGSKFEFIGSFDHIVNNGEKSDISLTGSVNTLTLNKSATVKGNGKITKAEVSAEAGKGTSFSTTPTSITGAGKSDVKLPSSTSNSSNDGSYYYGGGPSGGSGGDSGGNSGGDSGGTTTTYNVSAVDAASYTVSHKSQFSLPSTATATLSNGSTMEFNVSWSPATADTSVCGTFEFEGTLEMVSGYANPDSIKAKLTLTVEPVLDSIQIWQLPAKTLYLLGEDLDLTGLVVNGTYSDGSEQILNVSESNVSGYDKTLVGDQIVTVDINGKTQTFSVTSYNAANGTLASITTPGALTIANGSGKTAEGLGLPPRVEITLEDDSKTLANVTWDVDSTPYDPSLKTHQNFVVSGTVSLPEGVLNENDVPLETEISATVSGAKQKVVFNLNGQTGAAIATQTIEYGYPASKPTDPTSASHDFLGWNTSADGSGTAWNFADAVTEDVTLYAIWKGKTYTVTFDKGNAASSIELPDPLLVSHGALAVKPADPSLPELFFAGWYIDSALETLYTWSEPVTASLTLYAKFADTLMMAKDSLTFDIIKGGNDSEHNVSTNLALPATLSAYPGVTIEWSSDSEDFISNSGVVTRPEDEDKLVTLKATLSLDGKTEVKNFALTVRYRDLDNIEVTGSDARFASGYPVVSFDKDNKATIRMKLDPGVATPEEPVIAYLAFDGYTDFSYSLDKDSILYGYTSSNSDENGKRRIWQLSEVGEVEITGNEEVAFKADRAWSNGSEVYKLGIVLLKNDNISDPQATGTVISLTAEQANIVDMQAPSYMYPFLSEDKTKLYVYFEEKLSLSAANKTDPADWTIEDSSGSALPVSITNVVIENGPFEYGLVPGLVTLALSGALPDASSSPYLAYTPGSLKLADEATNPVTSKIWVPINTTAPTAMAYVNPSAGTANVTFNPGLHYWMDNKGSELSSLVTLKYNNSAISGFKYASGMWSTRSTEVFFTFNPLPSGTYSGDQFKLDVNSGLNFLNYRTIVVTDKPSTVIPPVITDNIHASFNISNGPYGSTIALTSSNLNLGQFNIPPCNFILKAGDERLLLRETVIVSESEILLRLGSRVAAKLKEKQSQGNDITTSYQIDPRFVLYSFSHLIDQSGAYLPNFGPVNCYIPY